MKKAIFIILAITILIASYFIFAPKDGAAEEQNIKIAVEQGTFDIFVTSTGELQAKNSEKIRGPEGLRTAGIYRTTISDLVIEGTILKEGDYVATLDRTEISNKLKDLSSEIEKVQTQLTQAKLDTALEMRGLRDQIVNVKFLKKEKLLEVQQSKYEPPMVIQRAQLDLERTERDYNQMQKKYELKEEQAIAKIKEILGTLYQAQGKFKMMNKLAEQFIIKAPKDGMVIYARSWNGKKGPGSQISAWDPVVAELPDLSDMVSKTYVNEVDISKVKKGQQVNLSIDAFPDRTYTGEVIKIANIGEQLPKFDAKVFEVVIQVNETDSILRPAMTTSNEVVIKGFDDVLHIPLEALHSNDSLSYVFKKGNAGLVKQEVLTGMFNEKGTIIKHGLNAGEQVYLSIPDNVNELDYVYLPESVKIDDKPIEQAITKKESDKPE